jgi:hypothetical protein
MSDHHDLGRLNMAKGECENHHLVLKVKHEAKRSCRDTYMRNRIQRVEEVVDAVVHVHRLPPQHVALQCRELPSEVHAEHGQLPTTNTSPP